LIERINSEVREEKKSDERGETVLTSTKCDILTRKAIKRKTETLTKGDSNPYTRCEERNGKGKLERSHSRTKERTIEGVKESAIFYPTAKEEKREGERKKDAEEVLAVRR